MGDKLFEITIEPISIDDVIRRVSSPAVGAVVSFTGIVRGTNAGRRVLYLEYETYPEMAELTLSQVAEEIKEQWSVEGVAIVHRVGKQRIGETSVAIAIASGHRRGAFEAGSFAIDRIKEIVPIWKKEYFEGGEVWIEGPDKPPKSIAKNLGEPGQ